MNGYAAAALLISAVATVVNGANALLATEPIWWIALLIISAGCFGFSLALVMARCAS